MPIYEFYCPVCNRQIEVIRNVRDRNNSHQCECGESMAKLVSLPQPAIFIATNRDMLVNGINDQEGKAYRFPGRKDQQEQYKTMVAKSLTRDKPIIGKGF